MQNIRNVTKWNVPRLLNYKYTREINGTSTVYNTKNIESPKYNISNVVRSTVELFNEIYITHKHYENINAVRSRTRGFNLNPPQYRRCPHCSIIVTADRKAMRSFVLILQEFLMRWTRACKTRGILFKLCRKFRMEMELSRHTFTYTAS